MCLFDYSMFRGVHLRFIFVNLRNITSKIREFPGIFPL